MGCDGLAWLLLRCFLLIPLFLRCVIKVCKVIRVLHADKGLSRLPGYGWLSGWSFSNWLYRSSRLCSWYRSVLLTYLWPAMYCTILRFFVLSHWVITLCLICWAVVTLGFSFLRAYTKCKKLFLMLSDPCILINSWLWALSWLILSGFLPVP